MKTLKECLGTVNDPRRAQGKRYDLVHTLLYCVLAVASGATSYRKIHAFIDTHWQRLNEVFGSTWNRAPAYTAVRKIVQALDAKEVEQALRRLACEQLEQTPQTPQTPVRRAIVTMDGKTLRGSLDRFEDRRAAQTLSALAGLERVVLGHIHMADQGKEHEIPAAQRLMAELGLAGCVITLDALHCQKNG